MALTLTIDAVDQTARLRDATLLVDKQYAVETCRLEIWDADGTAAAYRPVEGQVLRLVYNGGLLFAGPITRVTDKRPIDDDTRDDVDTVTVVEASDWLHVADQTIIERASYPAQEALALFDTLLETYLAPKGFTNIGPSSGGPWLPLLQVEQETLFDVLLRITEQCGWPFRVNGDKQAALVEPGSLAGPEPLTPATWQEGMTWTREQLVNANRLHFQTGVPPSGAGPVTHHETRTADGTVNVFPVNVLPNASRVAVVNDEAGYSTGATSMNVRGLTPGAVIKAGNSFVINGHDSSYAVGADATVDDQGDVAGLTFAPGLTANVAYEKALTFSPETFVDLLLDGVLTPTFGAPWVWDDVDQAFVNPDAAPAAGTSVVYRTRVTYPARMRVWETATPQPVQASGAFDRAILIDGRIDGTNQVDLATAAAWARDKLTERVVAPKVVRSATTTMGWYPLLSASATDGRRLVSGTHLIRSVTARGSEIDPSRDDSLLFEVEAVEGDRLLQNFVQFFRGENPALGIKWGAPPVFPAKVGQWVLEVGVSDPRLRIGQFALEVGYTDPDTPVRVGQFALEIAIAVEDDTPPPPPDLPTSGLTAHFDASDTDDLWTTYVSGGPHTGTPGDGDTVYVWEEAGGANLILKKAGGSASPDYRSTTPLLPLPCLDFANSSTNYLALTNNTGTSQPISAVIANNAFTVLVAFWAEAIGGATPTYQSDAILADSAGYWGVHLGTVSSVTKVSAYNYDGNQDHLMLDCSVGAPHVFMMRHESGTLYASLDGGAESSMASGNTTNISNQLYVGRGQTGSFNGRIGEFAIYNTALTGTDLSDAIAHFVAKWLP